MTGRVTSAWDATLSLRLRTSDGAPVGVVEATIDTGFTDFLLLPTEIVEPLDLTVQEEAVIGLGDGSTTRMNVVMLDVEWEGRWLTVPVHVADSDALVGGEVRVEPV